MKKRIPRENPHTSDPFDSTPPLNRTIRAYVEQSKLANASDPWVKTPELPTSEEIFGIGDNSIDLVPNQVDGPWASTGAYLNAHYDLLREDAVAPLRDAVAYVRDRPAMHDAADVCIYEKVTTFQNTLE